MDLFFLCWRILWQSWTDAVVIADGDVAVVYEIIVDE